MKQITSRQLYAYWNELRGERAAPARGEIDPGAIRHILADVFMLELDPVGQARFRLAGTRCCALFDRELRGTRFAQLWSGTDADEVERMIETVLDETAGVTAGLRASANGDIVELELLLLPIRYHGKTHARIIGALTPTPPAAWVGLSSIDKLETLSMRVIRAVGLDGPPLPLGEPNLTPRERFVVHQGGRA